MGEEGEGFTGTTTKDTRTKTRWGVETGEGGGEGCGDGEGQGKVGKPYLNNNKKISFEKKREID